MADVDTTGAADAQGNDVAAADAVGDATNAADVAAGNAAVDVLPLVLMLVRCCP